MKRLVIILLVFLILCLQSHAQQAIQQLNADKEVRMGRLSNGLTYYIHHNNWPEHRAEFYLAQRVGSIQEEEHQRGLAHFLEHMCFNGTEHFPGNGVIQWCEQHGMKFGADLNAYTSVDRTVYNISNVPTAHEGVLDSCLLILHDWADGLLLDPEEIDKERGVIHEEWRLRSTASQRMLERSLPRLFPGCKYGERMPIGLMSVVDSFAPQALRDYYEKWYRPDNQAVIVVGDVDVDGIENTIRNLFGGIRMPENPAPVITEMVPANLRPICIIEKDKEQRADNVQLYFKHEPMDEEQKQTAQFFVTNYLTSAAIEMLNARLAEAARKPDCPFLGAVVSDGAYIVAQSMGAFLLNISPKEGRTEEAVKAVMTEARRAAVHGFTTTEYDRVKANRLTRLEESYNRRDKIASRQFVSDYVENFLQGIPYMSLDDSYQLMKEIIPAAGVGMVNQRMGQLLPESDANMVVLALCHEQEGRLYPTEEGLLAAIDDARQAELTLYEDKVSIEPLISRLPARGRIVSEAAGCFGSKELTLSNGLKVCLLKTDYTKDRVSVVADGRRGTSMFGLADRANIAVMNQVVGASKLGGFAVADIVKMLAGTSIKAAMNISASNTAISGSSTGKDMESLFQLLYLYFTDISKDQQAFDQLMTAFGQALHNRELSADVAFSDSMTMTRYDHDPRMVPLQERDLRDISYDRIVQMVRELTQNAADYAFTVIGDFDESLLRPLIEQYVASLPVQPVADDDTYIDTTHKNVTNTFRRQMETPKANTSILWTNRQMEYSLENLTLASIAGQILQAVYLQKIREDAGAAYTVSAAGIATRTGRHHAVTLQAVCPMKPEKAQEALDILHEEAKALAHHCDAALLQKVKEYMLKSAADGEKTNKYWFSVLSAHRKYGLDFHTGYRQLLERLSPADICAFMAEFLQNANCVEVTMLPE